MAHSDRPDKWEHAGHLGIDGVVGNWLGCLHFVPIFEILCGNRHLLAQWNLHISTCSRRMMANGPDLQSSWCVRTHRTAGWVCRGGLIEQWRSHVAPDKFIHQTEIRQNRPTESRAKTDHLEASRRLPHRYTLAEYPLAIPAGFLVGRAPLEARSTLGKLYYHILPYR